MKKSSLANRQILLVITGGIAAYKSLELIRRLREKGAGVDCILTKGGAQFVTPLSVSSLTGRQVYQDLFSLTDETEMGHIQLSRQADMILVVPASADFMAKLAHGLADDLASTCLLAADKPIILAPAMNHMMWNNPATQNNLAILEQRGMHIIQPGVGDMACGETGPGRLAEIDEIMQTLDGNNIGQGPLSGKHAIVTAGPTHEQIDPVRFIANHSSGKQGYEIAAALSAAGCQVTLISGPTTLSAPTGIDIKQVTTASQMLAACQAALPADIAICTAAVCDWRIKQNSAQKIKKQQTPPVLELAENPDILRTLSQAGKDRPALIVGFAAETEDLLNNARHKLIKKGCDMIVANDVSADVFGSDQNEAYVLTRDQEPEHWPRSSKKKIADNIVNRIISLMHSRKENTA